MNVCFLLGAGISQPILDIDLDTISRSLFDDYWTLQNAIYYRTVRPEDEEPIVKNYKGFLNVVRSELEDYYRGFGEESNLNYEQLYFVCDQIKNINEYDKSNPLALKHIKEIQQKAEKYIRNNYGEELEIQDFAKQVCEYIDSIVFDHLVFDDEEFPYINLFDQLKEREIKGHIFTLNHDLLLEKYFQSKGIEYNDFFRDSEKSLRKFSIDDVGILDGFDFCLYKLHGSINWIREINDFYAYYCIDDYSNNLLETFSFLSPGISTAKVTPEIIAGHTNKVFDYHHGLYPFLMGKFIEELNNSDVLIVSGFGWKDYVIRQIIIEWLGHSESRRLVLAYENDADPRNFLSIKMRNRQVVNTGKWLADLIYSDISTHLND